MGDVVDFAKLQAQATGDCGKFAIFAVDSGVHVSVHWEDDQYKLQTLLTLDEARDLVSRLNRAIYVTRQIGNKVFGFVWLLWCDTRGEGVNSDSVRARIIEREGDSVLITIEPEKWQREPRNGWPKDGWYRFDGWPVAHDPKRRGWRIADLPKLEASAHAC